MTTTLSTIRSIALADATVSALVGTRVYPNELPQNVDLPAAVISVVSDVPEHSFTNSMATTLRSVRVQIDCYARTSASGGAYERAHALAEAMINAVGTLSSPDFSSNLETSRDIYDNVSQFHRVSIDLTVWR